MKNWMEARIRDCSEEGDVASVKIRQFKSADGDANSLGSVLGQSIEKWCSVLAIEALAHAVLEAAEQRGSVSEDERAFFAAAAEFVKLRDESRTPS